MSSEFNISFFPAESLKQSELTYVIIGAWENNKWIFVRHNERNSWELPAGHIELNETAIQAAKRELFEETGVTNSEMKAIFDYSVYTNGEAISGRIFYAQIIQREPLPKSEIAEIKLCRISPEPATYPEAHRRFIDILEKYIGQDL